MIGLMETPTRILACLALATLLTPSPSPSPLLAAVAQDAALPEPQRQLDIVDRSIEHHGGDLYDAVEVTFTIRSRSGAFDVTSRRDAGAYRTVITETVDQGERKAERVVDVSNDAVSVTVGGAAQDVATEGTEQRWRDFASARTYFPFLPYRLNDPSVAKRDLGVETWDGRELHKVLVTFDSGSSTDASDQYLYWFDPATARLEQLAYSFGEGERAGLRFRKLVNFRRVGGLLFADHENFGVDGRELPVTAVTPDFVDAEMERVSTVLVENLKVEALAE
jgi:hypothetical protein